MLVQPQQAATVCEFDLVPHTIGSLERAQTLYPNPRPESSHEPLNLTLDLEHAHVRSLGWFGRWRRLSKDYEMLPEVSEAMVTLAAIRLMLHRLAHPNRRRLPAS